MTIGTKHSTTPLTTPFIRLRNFNPRWSCLTFVTGVNFVVNQPCDKQLIMAKSNTKAPAPKAAKKAAPKAAKTTKAEKVATVSIEKLSQQVLDKLVKMDAEHQLQAEIKWCLGSYNYDKNPKGLYETAAKALKYFTVTRESNPKAVPAKLVTDLTKALKQA